MNATTQDLIASTSWKRVSRTLDLVMQQPRKELVARETGSYVKPRRTKQGSKVETKVGNYKQEELF